MSNYSISYLISNSSNYLKKGGGSSCRASVHGFLSRMENAIYTVHIGDNSGLIKKVADLYFQEGDSIADVTYGKGVFWRNIDNNKYKITGSDLKNGIDFRCLPYNNETFCHGVLDPPYARTGLGDMVKCYNTSKSSSHSEIMELYRAGIKELYRIVKPGGFILVKCQDEVYGCKQRWSHIEIKDMSEELGLYARDMFILVNTKTPKVHYKQKHARKNHSYLWIFEKTAVK